MLPLHQWRKSAVKRRGTRAPQVRLNQRRGQVYLMRVRIYTLHDIVSKMPALFQRRFQYLTCSVYLFHHRII